MIESFEDVTKIPYGYPLIDLKAETDDRFRLRTGIFPKDTLCVFVPK